MSRNSVRAHTFAKLACCPSLFERRVNRKKVVFANEQDRQLVEGREIETFVKYALFSGAVAKKSHNHTAFAFTFQGKRITDRDRYSGSNDGRCPQDVMRHVDQMHR